MLHKDASPKVEGVLPCSSRPRDVGTPRETFPHIPNLQKYGERNGEMFHKKGDIWVPPPEKQDAYTHPPDFLFFYFVKNKNPYYMLEPDF